MSIIKIIPKLRLLTAVDRRAASLHQAALAASRRTVATALPRASCRTLVAAAAAVAAAVLAVSPFREVAVVEAASVRQRVAAQLCCVAVARGECDSAAVATTRLAQASALLSRAALLATAPLRSAQRAAAATAPHTAAQAAAAIARRAHKSQAARS